MFIVRHDKKEKQESFKDGVEGSTWLVDVIGKWTTRDFF